MVLATAYQLGGNMRTKQDLLDLVYYKLVHDVPMNDYERGFVAGYLHSAAEMKLLDRWLDRSIDEEPRAILDDVISFIEKVNW